MLRTFDFSVEPGNTYRYRTRLVFRTQAEPNIARGQPAKREDFGPWSEPTAAVVIDR